MAFNPDEPRALDGKWIKGIAHLAAAKKIAALPLGKKATIKGNPVRHLEGKGYRVRIDNVGVNYKHPEDAARSMVAGKHMPASKHIAELENKPNKSYKEQQTLKSLHAQEQQFLASDGTSTEPAVAPHVPPMATLKSGKSVVGTLGGMSKAKAQNEYDMGNLTTTEYVAKFGSMPDHPKVSAASLDMSIVNGIRKELGLKAINKSDVTGAPTSTASAVKSASASALPSFDPKALPAGAPSGSLIGGDVWSSLPTFKPGDSSVRDSIKHYTGSAYININASLRKGLVSSSTASVVREMDKAFAQVNPTTHDIIVYRGVSAHDTMFGSVGSHKNGVFIDSGFVSTSANHGTATSFGGGAFIRIIIPKGSKVVKTEGISSHTSEREIILNRGSMFEIIEDQMQADDTYGHMGGLKRRVITLKLVG